MFRQVRRLLLLPSPGGIVRGAARSLSSDPPAAPAQDAAFVGPHKKVAPNIEPPKTPLSPRPPTLTSIRSKLAVNVVLPYRSELANKENAQESTGSIVQKEDPIVHYDCKCSKRCFRYMRSCFTDPNWVSGRINEYKKFEKHLQDCDNIKDVMTADEVLNLQEVDLFRTRLNKGDRTSCALFHLLRLRAQRVASQIKAFLIDLLESDIHLEVRKHSYNAVLEELHIIYSHLPSHLIPGSLQYLAYTLIPEHELSGPISEHTRKRIEQYIENQYKYYQNAKGGLMDPTEHFK